MHQSEEDKNYLEEKELLNNVINQLTSKPFIANDQDSVNRFKALVNMLRSFEFGNKTYIIIKKVTIDFQFLSQIQQEINKATKENSYYGDSMQSLHRMLLMRKKQSLVVEIKKAIGEKNVNMVKKKILEAAKADALGFSFYILSLKITEADKDHSLLYLALQGNDHHVIACVLLYATCCLLNSKNLEENVEHIFNNKMINIIKNNVNYVNPYLREEVKDEFFRELLAYQNSFDDCSNRQWNAGFVIKELNRLLEGRGVNIKFDITSLENNCSSFYQSVDQVDGEGNKSNIFELNQVTSSSSGQ